MQTPGMSTALGSKLLLLTFALLPIWFFPFSIDPFFAPKSVVFVLLATALFAIWAVRTLRTGRVRFSLATPTALTLVAALVASVSALLAANPATQFTGRLLVWWAIPVVLLFGTSLLPKIRWSHILQSLLIGGALLSVLTALQLTPLAPSNILLNFWPIQIDNPALFNLSGSLLAMLQILIPVVAAGIVYLLDRRNETSNSGSALSWLVLSLLGVVGLIAAGVIIVRNPETVQILPFQFGWGIMIEGFKNPRLFFLGAGPENFLLAFHLFRDAAYNTTELWATRFNVSSTEILQIMTTTGLIGVASWLAVFLLSLRQARLLKQSRSLFVYLFTLFVMFLITPFTTITWILLGLGLLALNLELLHQLPNRIRHLQVMLTAIQLYSLNQRGNNENGGRGFAIGAVILLTLLAGTSVLWVGRVFGAQMAYYLSLQAASENDGIATYNRQQLAKNLQPRDPAYRRTFASTSLALATSLSQQEERTEEQEQIMLQLIQQAIQEGRNAVSLDPNSTESWETLAAIYEQLLSIEGANEWALAARVTAVQTDPVAPQLRLALGDLYLSQAATPSAQSMYEQTIQLKPDWPLAYTRYGIALEQLQRPDLALASYQRAQSILPAETTEEDRQTLQQKISELQQVVAQLQQQQGQGGSESIPTPGSPTVPEQPALAPEQTPEDFQQVVENGGAVDQTEEGQNTGDIVLPEDVGI